jgi:hypothetical protein
MSFFVVVVLQCWGGIVVVSCWWSLVVVVSVVTTPIHPTSSCLRQ